MADIVYISTEGIFEEVKDVFKDESAKLEGFVAEGKASLMPNAPLQDLWPPVKCA